MTNKQKIIAVASVGGHLVQLLTITKALEKYYEIIYCSTHTDCRDLIGGCEYYLMEDFNRKTPWKLISGFIKQVRMIKKNRPVAVISTGAAPGLAALMAAKVCGVKSIWIDSIANVQQLSASGRIARKFVSRIYTQWPALADENVIYAGNVLNQ